MRLYHSGFEIIRKPDIHYGRRNADFGQGFYLTADEEFAHRWARMRSHQQTIVNTYELDTSELVIRSFQRDPEWFAYLYGNRNGTPDDLLADVVIGAIANDTIYDTFGIITSGFLRPEEAMKLLLIGPEYRQIAIKTEKAARKLRWLSAEELSPDEVAAFRAAVAEEEAEYQRLFAQTLEKLVQRDGD